MSISMGSITYAEIGGVDVTEYVRDIKLVLDHPEEGPDETFRDAIRRVSGAAPPPRIIDQDGNPVRPRHGSTGGPHA